MQQQGKIGRKRNGLTERLKKKDASVWRVRIERICAEGGYLGAGFLLGQANLLFDTVPLGLALLCAGRKHTLSILAGLILSAWVLPSMRAVYIITYVVAAVIRLISGMLLDAPDGRDELEAVAREKLKYAEHFYGDGTDGWEEETHAESAWELFLNTRWMRAVRAELGVMFGEHVRLRMATAAVCSLIPSLYRVITGGFAFFDWFAALFCVLVVPSAVMIYSVFLEGHREAKWMYTVSAVMLVFSLVLASVGWSVLGFSVPLVLAFCITLYACLAYGVAMGCLAGLSCGLAIDFLYAPAFLLAALIFSFLQSKKKSTAGIFPAVLGALAWLIYVQGALHLIELLPSLLFAGAVFTPICAYFHAKESHPEETEDANAAETTALRRRFAGEQYESSNEKLRNISEAFSSLSEMFYNLSDRFRRPGTLDLRCICDRAFDAHCSDCPNKTVCWGLEYSDTLGTVNGLISALHKRGSVTKAQIPSHLCHRCSVMDAILESINRDCARLTGELLRNNRTEIFAMDYEAAAKIINDALEEDDGEYSFDPELEQQIMEYLADAGILASGVTVYGQRRRQILVRGADVEHATVTAETLRSDLGEMCGMHLGHASFEVEEGVSTMLLQAKKKISVLGAQNNLSADGGVSGDTVNLFSNKKDYFYALINDGMGSGREAALTSNLCSVFLEKMLRAGNRAGTSLRMLNNMIRSRGVDSTGECSSTVDLLELDLMTAEASFIKSGASPSFVVRGGVVHRLQSGTVPIGIISKLDTQIKRYTVRPGDTLVLISDGIEQNDPDCKWLTSYLETCEELTPEEIVYQICLHAAEGEVHDDCSAIALRICEPEE